MAGNFAVIATSIAALSAVWPAAVPTTATKIPLCPGLTIVTAITEPEGDYESIKTVDTIDASAVRMRYSMERVARELAGHPIEKVKVPRIIRVADLRSATRYMQVFGYAIPSDVPGTTAIGTSTVVLTSLKHTGAAELSVFDLRSGHASDTPYSVNLKEHPNVYDSEVRFKLLRAETTEVTIPLLVNGEKAALPAIHATGTAEWGEKGEFFFLDDEDNPLSLRWKIRTSSISTRERAVLQVVKIAFHCAAGTTLPPVSPLERALAERGRADVYEIYFSFNSDEIREESEPTLREIGDIMRRHPDWKLSIEGHTDGIAGDAFNLDLSKRRAAAVKQALVTRYTVGDSRLATAGYGKSRPRDTNETPEGRARNRRVELVRQ